VNVFSPIEIMQNTFPYLEKDKRCHVINVGSMGGFQGSVKFPGLSIYSSSKAALANLTECLAEEYKDKSIFINCLALGSVQTEMLESAFPGYAAQVSAFEMAKYIAEFSKQEPIYINGKVLPISNSTP
jgi:short-subunit dehydrogenase